MPDFFIHDHMVQAVHHLYPAMRYGRDFMVLMGVNRDGTPASDAWIEGWPEIMPMPTLDELRAAYADSQASPAA